MHQVSGGAAGMTPPDQWVVTVGPRFVEYVHTSK